MRRIRFTLALVGPLAIALALVAVPAASAARWVTGQASEVRVTGTSTLHDWKMTTKEIQGELDVDAGFLAAPGTGTWQAAPAPTMSVTIAVDSISSEHDKMNKLMREALDSKAQPEIRYVLKEATLVSAEGSSFVVATQGDLTVRGVTREVAMEVKAVPGAAGGLVLTGELPVRMTDYGVKPPVAMLGTIKTKPDVVVAFQWVVVPAP